MFFQDPEIKIAIDGSEGSNHNFGPGKLHVDLNIYSKQAQNQREHSVKGGDVEGRKKKNCFHAKGIERLSI